MAKITNTEIEETTNETVEKDLTPKEKIAMLETKIKGYEKLITTFKQQADQAIQQLNRATTEYNARLKYMQDCIKHAYISIQLAEKAQGGLTTND